MPGKPTSVSGEVERRWRFKLMLNWSAYIQPLAGPELPPEDGEELMPVSDHEAVTQKREAHCKEVEQEASEMVDSTVDAWVDRLDAFEGRLRAEIKQRTGRIGSSSSVLLADVDAAIEISRAHVRVTGAGSPSQVLARQWKSRAEKAEAALAEARLAVGPLGQAADVGRLRQILAALSTLEDTDGGRVAQLDRDAGGVAPSLSPVDEWPFDDPPDPL